MEHPRLLIAALTLLLYTATLTLDRLLRFEEVSLLYIFAGYDPLIALLRGFHSSIPKDLTLLGVSFAAALYVNKRFKHFVVEYERAALTAAAFITAGKLVMAPYALGVLEYGDAFAKSGLFWPAHFLLGAVGAFFAYRHLEAPAAAGAARARTFDGSPESIEALQRLAPGSGAPRGWSGSQPDISDINPREMSELVSRTKHGEVADDVLASIRSRRGLPLRVPSSGAGLLDVRGMDPDAASELLARVNAGERFEDVRANLVARGMARPVEPEERPQAPRLSGKLGNFDDL